MSSNQVLDQVIPHTMTVYVFMHHKKRGTYITFPKTVFFSGFHIFLDKLITIFKMFSNQVVVFGNRYPVSKFQLNASYIQQLISTFVKQWSLLLIALFEYKPMDSLVDYSIQV